MGREIKRVPVDFDWPLDETWQGYLMPEALRVPDCTDCSGQGATAARLWVGQIAQLLLMLDDDLDSQARGWDLHPYLRDTGSVVDARTRPSPDIRAFGVGLGGRESSRFLGHDAIDRFRATDAVIRGAGLDPKAWGLCPTCAGTGLIEAYPGQAADAEAWEPTEPPAGEGWQVWQTVSEGSPITPVFPGADALIDHLVFAGTVWDQRRDEGGWRRPAAESFVMSGWAPSGVVAAGQVMQGGRDSDLIDQFIGGQ